jgi:hypothetical protein
MRASAADPSRLPIKMTGSTGPSPPLLVEPVTALTRLVTGEEPLPPEAAAIEESVRLAVLEAAGCDRVGAMACASAAAATPCGP